MDLLEKKPVSAPSPSDGVVAFGCVAVATLFFVGFFSCTTRPVQTPAASVAEASDPARQEVVAILAQDGWTPSDKVFPVLMDCMRQCCSQYHCTPAEVRAAAERVRAAQRKGGAKDATLTGAANMLPGNQRAKSIQEAADELVHVFGKRRP